jgi:hypothetical protein
VLSSRVKKTDQNLCQHTAYLPAEEIDDTLKKKKKK